MDLSNKTILCTGATGSFGQAFTRYALDNLNPKKIIVYSRDELKQFEMQQKFKDDRIRYFIGDIRDKDRLEIALRGVDIVVHACALKQVPAIEYNPYEAVKTNVIGSQNLIEAAINQGVEKVIALSTDKACNPANAYGATKLMAEKLFIQGNAYASGTATKFSVVRYGNVINSRGSVVPFFNEKRKTGVIPITHYDMTRFWITLEQACEFVVEALNDMQGAEIFIPLIPSCKIVDLAQAIAPECKTEIVGIRPGEKLHETLITIEEAHRTIKQANRCVIYPAFPVFERKRLVNGLYFNDSEYRSDTNTKWFSVDELKAMAGKQGCKCACKA